MPRLWWAGYCRDANGYFGCEDAQTNETKVPATPEVNLTTPPQSPEDQEDQEDQKTEKETEREGWE